MYVTAAVHKIGKEIELYDFSCAQAEIVLRHQMHQLA